MKSEFELIDAFARRIRRAGANPRGVVVGVGDDAAVLRPNAREDLVVTTDSLVEGVHFERRWLYGVNLGRRLAAVNLSDIAAMGAEPRFALVSFAIPRGTPGSFVEDIERGAVAMLARYGAHVVGGNLTSTRGPLVCDMTVIGACARGRAWRRDARAGDVIIVAGELGAAAAGVQLLRSGKKGGALVRAYTHPVPRLDVSRVLSGTKVVRGAIDVSDGLSSDLIHLCEAGGVGCEIHAHALPIGRGVRAFCRARGEDPASWALHAGEDYALVLAVPRKHAVDVCRIIKRSARVPAAIVGTVTKERGVYRIIESGSRVRAFRPGGWDHMKKKRR
ncbi:MAG TPA: thiamine-phosphate kinase [Candidatus Krumholzibacteria bacterium]|nr:thiamine-phosphate kinase [Candidatus Krumholzibacteria bacterium]